MSEGGAFDALTEEFYPVWFRYHPERARAAGVPGYEGLLPAHQDDDMGVLAAWLESLMVAIEELDFHALDQDRRLDLRLLFDEAQTEYEALLEQDWRHRDPLRFLPSAEVLHLACPPGEAMWTNLAELMRQVPEYLRHATGQLLPLAELLAPALAQATATAADEGAAYLRELTGSQPIRLRRDGGELVDLCNQAATALAAFAERLRREVVPEARGALGCGRPQWRFLLRRRHGLRLDEGALRAFLARAVAEARSDLETEARALGVSGDATGIEAALAPEAPLRGEARRQAYRVTCDQLAERLSARGLMPEVAAPLLVRDLPDCPYPPDWNGGYRAEYERGRGVIYLDPSPQGEPPSLIAHRCLALGAAGAHLLAFAGGEAGQRLPRRLSAGESLAKGWGLYLWGHLASDPDTPPTEALLLRWERWRGLRLAELDLQLHLDGRPQRALEESLAGLEPQTRRREGLLMTVARQPSDWVAGAVGWRILERARQSRCDQGGEGLEAFHRRLFSAGTLPLALLIEAVFGPELWAQVADGLLD